MDKESIKTQMDILVQISRCIEIKQVLSELDANPKLNFWRLIYGGFLDLPVLDWCKIFGTDGEPTHWKGIIEDKSSFRKELFGYLEITKEEWAANWDHMHSYRNEFVAHHKADSDISTYPDLDLALKSSHFYHDFLLNMLNEGKVDQLETLEMYSSRFRAQVKKIAQSAIGATSGHIESVY